MGAAGGGGDSTGFALIELKEAGRGLVDLKGLFMLGAVNGADEVPEGVKELGSGAFNSLQI
jgi:hypothetical protein